MRAPGLSRGQFFLQGVLSSRSKCAIIKEECVSARDRARFGGLMQDKRYLQQLSLQYPTANDAAMEIINLSSILNLPKGTVHFITDIHGGHESFLHI